MMPDDERKQLALLATIARRLDHVQLLLLAILVVVCVRACH